MEERRILGPELPELGGALEFEGVTLRVFPLRADRYSLEKFCDGYLNVDLEQREFEPAMPLVLLVVVNYGKMSPAASSLGWVSQNEVVFSVPLRWHRGDSGRPEWATVTPYIFVDSPQSTITGREVYGWPKVLAWFEPGLDAWLSDPRAPRRVLELRTLMFSRLYAGEPLAPRVLLEVEHRPGESLLQFPPDPANLWSPLFQRPPLGVDWLTAAWGGATGSQTWMELLDLGRQVGGAPGEALRLHTINLKQFRSSELAPGKGPTGAGTACYQALINAPLTLKSYRGSGPLGDLEQLRGDASGGFRIRIHRNRSFPIVEALGLEVSEEVAGAGAAVSVLSPVAPFWVSADLRYEAAERLRWRVDDGAWLSGSELPQHRSEPRRGPPYVTTTASLAQPVEGPFEFWDASVRLLALAADPDVLQEHVDGSLGRACGELARLSVIRYPELDPGGGAAMVLLMVSSYGRMSAPANDVGWWARRQLAFTVPVEVEPLGREPAPSFPALYWAYVFNDSPLAVSTGREFTGLPSEYARFVVGEGRWLERGGLTAERSLMSLRTSEFPALGVGQPAEECLLLEIVEPAAAAKGRPRTLEALPTGTITGDELAMIFEPYRSISADAIQTAGPVRVPITGLYFDNLLLKQFRDAVEPELACYQALVASRTVVGRWRRDDGAPLARVVLPRRRWQVRVHEYPQHPIVGELGLEVAGVELGEGGERIHRLDPRRSYWLEADLQHRRGQTLAWRAQGGAWEGVAAGRRYLARAADEDLQDRDLDSLLRRIRRAVGA